MKMYKVTYQLEEEAPAVVMVQASSKKTLSDATEVAIIKSLHAQQLSREEVKDMMKGGFTILESEEVDMPSAPAPKGHICPTVAQDEREWLIWSIEHNGWWKAGRSGYSELREEAGVYSTSDALEIVKGANIGLHDVPNEAMIAYETNSSH